MGAFIGNAARETILDHEDGLFQEAADRELVKRLNRAVAVLSDMTNDKDTISVLFQKYWEIDQCEANSLVQGEIRERCPARRLANHLKSEKSYNPFEARRFIEVYDLPKRLKEGPGLSTMRFDQL